MPRRSCEFFLANIRCDLKRSKSATLADLKFEAIAISCFFYGCCEFLNLRISITFIEVKGFGLSICKFYGNFYLPSIPWSFTLGILGVWGFGVGDRKTDFRVHIIKSNLISQIQKNPIATTVKALETRLYSPGGRHTICIAFLSNMRYYLA
jgi:hypothetical protein